MAGSAHIAGNGCVRSSEEEAGSAERDTYTRVFLIPLRELPPRGFVALSDRSRPVEWFAGLGSNCLGEFIEGSGDT
jgi:hypothetical protein